MSKSIRSKFLIGLSLVSVASLVVYAPLTVAVSLVTFIAGLTQRNSMDRKLLTLITVVSLACFVISLLMLLYYVLLMKAHQAPVRVVHAVQQSPRG